MNFTTKLYVKVTTKFSSLVKNERGSQTLEWIGIAAVIVIVVGIISQAFAGDQDFGKAVLDKFKGMISKIGGGE